MSQQEKESWQNYYNQFRGGSCDNGRPTPCPQLPGTVLRVFIPAGATINVLNLAELTSPSGICLILRLPFLGGTCSAPVYNVGDLAGIMNTVRSAGGTVEIVN